MSGSPGVVLKKFKDTLPVNCFQVGFYFSNK